MKQKLSLMIVVVMLVTCLMGGFIFASAAENTTAPTLPHSSRTTASLDFSIIDNLIKTMA